tara:strand:- start:2352 stop:3029 length:678 start_codon:yes stop_codon:yes gene_type:complete
MTNFQKELIKRKNLLTPESSTVLLPSIGGALFAMILLIALYTPLSLQNKENKNELTELQRKQNELPLLESNLNIAIEKVNTQKEQQNRLLNLVAGTRRLETYIAKIDEIAQDFNLNIIYIKPLPTELPNQVSPTSSQASIANIPNNDPLLFPTLEKRSLEIKIKGNYLKILEFLRNLESLKVAILTSDIELFVPPNVIDQNNIITEISMKLSAYGPRVELNQLQN